MTRVAKVGLTLKYVGFLSVDPRILKGFATSFL